jgi:hypothetical protein
VPARRWIERIEPFGRQIPNTQSEPVAKNGTGGEDMIGEATSVGELLSDVAAGIVHEQPVEDVGCFARRRGNQSAKQRPDLR